ncbi:hypothetical protein RF11_14467 [Thelohanellus kitauei]|uniref:Uncharacterized protein n=1 Tax=Thelohanellus kitauei TaxID=669202 RepID=A0A0C2IZ11_THEKT|nr:hypothetical protein RF11_14467 [Thelohanellus kitauei]
MLILPFEVHSNGLLKPLLIPHNLHEQAGDGDLGGSFVNWVLSLFLKVRPSTASAVYATQPHSAKTTHFPNCLQKVASLAYVPTVGGHHGIRGRLKSVQKCTGAGLYNFN